MLKTPAASEEEQSVIERWAPCEQVKHATRDSNWASDCCCRAVVAVATSNISPTMDNNRLSAMLPRQPAHLRLANDRRSPYGNKQFHMQISMRGWGGGEKEEGERENEVSDWLWPSIRFHIRSFKSRQGLTRLTKFKSNPGR